MKPARWLLLLLGITASALRAQVTPPAAQENLRVFVDCNFCDFDFLRTEITFIDYVRDRQDADVHILVTELGTGAGGLQFTLEFLGLRRFAAVHDTLRYTSSPDDTHDQIRRGLTNRIKIGLMRFVASTPTADQIRITLAPATTTTGTTQRAAAKDPWNYWVFNTRFSTNFNGESLSGSQSFNGSLSANRTTENLKINLSANGNYNERWFQFDPAEPEDRFITRSYRSSGLIVKSIGGHTSAGTEASISTSTFGNQELAVSFGPAFEWNLFPYTESTRRSMTVLYSVNLNRYAYRDTTIWNQIEETVGSHAISAALNMTQTWGSLGFSLSGTQYLHDTQRYNMGAFGSANIRLFKGFSLNFFGSYNLVRDQLSLPREEATEEEILLRLRALKTNYSYFGNIGISYRFGSALNNVVNPRFDNRGGGGIFFF